MYGHLLFTKTGVDSGKLLITDRRNRLGDEVIEALECMKSWRKAGLLDEPELDAVEVMLRDLETRAGLLSSPPSAIGEGGGS